MVRDEATEVSSHQLIHVADDASLNDVGKGRVLGVQVGLELTRDESTSHVSTPFRVFRTEGP